MHLWKRRVSSQSEYTIINLQTTSSSNHRKLSNALHRSFLRLLQQSSVLTSSMLLMKTGMGMSKHPPSAQGPQVLHLLLLVQASPELTCGFLWKLQAWVFWVREGRPAAVLAPAHHLYCFLMLLHTSGHHAVLHQRLP